MIVGVVGLALLEIWPGAGCSRTLQCPETSGPRVFEIEDQRIQIGCSMCVYKMAGSTDCELAAVVNGETYLVEGSGIDDHGDAHAADGLCNMARQARATGRVEGERLRVTALVAESTK
jgi:hypothetical protein